MLGTLKYLCFIPDMSSELFRALTSAATLICSAVAAVCDHEVFFVAHLRDCVAAPMLGKTDGVRRTPLQKWWTGLHPSGAQ